MAGVVFLVADVRQVRPGDLQDVGAVLGQGAGAGRPGEDPRQVEHADARQRPIAVGKLFRRALADLDDLHQRQRGDRGGLRVPGPFVHGAHHAAGALRGDDRLLELERVPLRHRLAHRLAIFRHAEHARARRRDGSGSCSADSSSGRSWPGRRPSPCCARSTRARRPSACSARCGARRSPGGYRPRPPGAARCAVPTDRRRRGRPPRARRRWSRRSGTASARSDRRRR